MSEINVTIDSEQPIEVSFDNTVQTFLGLLDTPSTYAGQATKTAQVNVDETAIEFVTNQTTDEKIKISANDTTAGFLNGKLVGGTGIDLIEGNDAGDETLTANLDSATIASLLLADSALQSEVDPVFIASQAFNITSGDITNLGNLSGTNTGDQSSIVGISGTKAQFNTALSDGTFAFAGGAFHDGFSDFVAGEHFLQSAISIPASQISDFDIEVANNSAVTINTAKVTNVTTNLSEGTTTNTTVDVDSSDGTNATLAQASTSRAGVMSKAKFDEVVANTAKTSNATHTGEVTGATALTLNKTAISNRADTAITTADTILFGDATDTNNLKKDTAQGLLDLVPTQVAGVAGDMQINIAGSFGVLDGVNLDTTGNARGAGALDMQSNRSAVTQVASGACSSVFGARNTASGSSSSIFGYSNIASAGTSSAFGYSNVSCAGFASTMGYNNTASAFYSSAFGSNSTASGSYSFASGSGGYGAGPSATGSSSVAVGTASGYGGRKTQATATKASAFGVGTCASGCCSSAFGYQNTASGSFSSASGYYNTASGTYASAVGYLNTASGIGSSASGYFNTASGCCSSASGYSNTASGSYSSALGFINTASATCASSFGSNVNNSTACSVEIGPNNTYKIQTTSNGDYLPNTTNAQDLGGTSNVWDGIHVNTVNVKKRLLGAKGADVASADEITLGDGNYFDITGTTTINHITNTGWTAGSMVTLQFDASVTVTHNAGTPTGTEASILLAGAGDWSTPTAGDTLLLAYDGTFFREVSRTVI